MGSAKRDKLTVQTHMYRYFNSFVLCSFLLLTPSQVGVYVGQLANRLRWLDTNAPHIQTLTHAFPGGFVFPSNVLTTCAWMRGMIGKKERKQTSKKERKKEKSAFPLWGATGAAIHTLALNLQRS